MEWQKRAGRGRRLKAGVAIGRWKQVIGNGLRSRKDGRRTAEGVAAACALNRTLEFGRPTKVRIV